MMSGEYFPHANNDQFELELDWGIPTLEEIEEVVDTRSEAERNEAELDQATRDIWDIAREHGLDPFPTHFEIAPVNVINEVAGYGVPGRFGHWTFGREYAKMKTQHEYGLSKIYELVVNGNPSEAFLLDTNPVIENKFVIAHVLGHTDFFKNNFRFEPTREDMLQVVEENAERIRNYEDLYGWREVEKVIDHVMAIEDHYDPYGPKRPWGDVEMKLWEAKARKRAEDRAKPIDYGAFNDLFQQPEITAQPGPFRRADMQVPPEPDVDILGYIRNHSEYLEDWQRDIVDIVRSEAIYFFPQRRTKIMNEGWAAYWHKRIMIEMNSRELISDADSEVWRKLHTGVVGGGPGQLNPYQLGMEMYEYLEDYYNGHLSKDETVWLEKHGVPTYPRYDGPLKDSPATPHLREIMMTNDDQSIIRTYFDKNFAERMHLYAYEEHEYFGERVRVVKPGGWKEVREKLVEMLDNSGTPRIEVVDGNYRKSNQLYMRHNFDGRPLDDDYIRETLPHLYELWQRPVHLETVRQQKSDEKKVLYTYAGESIVVKDIS